MEFLRERAKRVRRRALLVEMKRKQNDVKSYQNFILNTVVRSIHYIYQPQNSKQKNMKTFFYGVMNM
jgi:hypothetical protein